MYVITTPILWGLLRVGHRFLTRTGPGHFVQDWWARVHEPQFRFDTKVVVLYSFLWGLCINDRIAGLSLTESIPLRMYYAAEATAAGGTWAWARDRLRKTNRRQRATYRGVLKSLWQGWWRWPAYRRWLRRYIWIEFRTFVVLGSVKPVPTALIALLSGQSLQQVALKFAVLWVIGILAEWPKALWLDTLRAAFGRRVVDKEEPN